MKLLNALILTATAISLSSCAVGSVTALTSGTAGVSVYSMKADEANNLSPEGEHNLIKRIKAQMVVPQTYIEVREDVRC